MPKQKEGSKPMSWRASISMPPEAGVQLEEIGKEMGVTAPVVARILLLEKLRERAIQDRQARAHIPTAYDWSGKGKVAESKTSPYVAPSNGDK